MTLTLRQVIPQKVAMKHLGVEHHSYMLRHYEAAARIGKVTFYRLGEVGLDESVVPDDLPDYPLDTLRTRPQMVELLSYSRSSIYLLSDFNGGWIKTVSPYGVSRFWLETEPQHPGICGGTTLTGHKCLIRITGGGRCKLHSSQATNTSK